MTCGRVDTGVDVAATSIYARFEDTTPEEFLRVMEVDLVGQVHGALGNLHAPRTGDHRTEGDFSGRARRFSLYAWSRLHVPTAPTPGDAERTPADVA